MFDRLIFVLLAVAVLVISRASVAGVDRWTPIGPVGAPLVFIATDPKVASTLYASEGRHLYRSIDTGTTWRATTALPTRLGAPFSTCEGSYFVHPADGAIFATVGSEAFRSTDRGDSWQSLSVPDICSFVGGDPTDGLVVYGSPKGQSEVFKSADGGLTWVQLSSPSPNIRPGGVMSILVDATQRQVLYASVYGGLFRSTDGGAHWASASLGLPTTAPQPEYLVQVGTKLLAFVNGGGIYQSTDQAQSWSPSNTGLTDWRVVALATSPGSVSPLYLLTGLQGNGVSLSSFRSDDDGATWIAGGPLTPFGPLIFGGGGLSGGGTVPLAVGTPPHVFANTWPMVGTGMVVSNDGGLSWHPISMSSGLSNVPTPRLLIDSSDPKILYAGSFFNIGYASHDRGAHWNTLAMFDGHPPVPLAVSPTHTGVVYSLSSDLVRSADYGNRWVGLNFPLSTNTTFLNTVRESTTDSNRIVVGGYAFPSQFLFVSPVLIKTSDSGETWQDASGDLTQGYVGPVAIDPIDEQTMYVGINNGVFKTTNGGDLWVRMGSGLGSATVVEIAISPERPNVVYAATGRPANPNDSSVGGLYVSFDGGGTWTFNQSLGHVALTSLALDPLRPTTLYVGSDGQGVFRSTNASQTWTSISDGLTTIEALRIRMVAVEPSDTRNLYVGTDAGAYALTLANPGSVATVIEYYSPQFDDYFITPVIDEIHVLDTQVIPGWYRTGYSFEAYVQPTPGADPLCRFYIPPASHFFSGLAAECAAVSAFNVPPFVYESGSSFYLPAPDMQGGACPPGLIPVYRLYNNKPSLTNHRYTTDLVVKAQMVAKGYIAEGYGPNRVMMCAPQ